MAVVVQACQGWEAGLGVATGKACRRRRLWRRRRGYRFLAAVVVAGAVAVGVAGFLELRERTRGLPSSGELRPRFARCVVRVVVVLGGGGVSVVVVLAGIFVVLVLVVVGLEE